MKNSYENIAHLILFIFFIYVNQLLLALVLPVSLNTITLIFTCKVVELGQVSPLEVDGTGNLPVQIDCTGFMLKKSKAIIYNCRTIPFITEEQKGKNTGL